MDIEIELKNIQSKLKQVGKQHQSLQKKNARLNKELERSKLAISQQSQQFNTLQYKADALKLGVNNWSPEEKADLEKRIDEYLKEIEKCLALLNA